MTLYPYHCCNVETNLEEKSTQNPSLKLLVCRVCARRHFEATAEPGFIGIKMAGG